MRFRDRKEAGKLLAAALSEYKGKKVVVYALPRGGVVTALEIAKYLDAPLDLIIARKIGHPDNPEYAIAAVAENGHMLGTEKELTSIDAMWLAEEIKKQRREAKRRREKYLKGRKEVSVKGKIAILVDDGVATGLTMRAGIVELRHRGPKEIIVAVPVVPQSTAEILKSEADRLVALSTPSDFEFLGSVGAYYDEFLPVEDEEVITILKRYDQARGKKAVEFSRAMPPVDPILYTFSSHAYMVETLQEIPHLSIGSFSLERFPNDELHITLTTKAVERECIVLGNINPPETNLVSYLLLCHTLRKENAYRITALLPYLAYSRHDKKEPQKSMATELIGKLLSSAGVDEVVTVDVHSPYVKRLFPIPLLSLSPARVFAEEIKKRKLEEWTIVAPDEGAKRRCNAVAKLIGSKRVSVMFKERSSFGVKHLDVQGEVGKRVIIIDDILDTGKTLVSACDALRKKGVKEIIIMVTHGLFTGAGWKKLWDLNVQHIYCTDTLPRPKAALSKKITTLSVTHLLVAALRQEHIDFVTIDASQRYDFYDIDEP